MAKVFPYIAALVVLALIWGLDVTAALGAHPWWSGKVVIYGGGAGLVLTALTGRVPGFWQLAGFAVLAGVAFWVASSGKAAFAASYAEDAFAGRMWFFGWHAVMAGVAGFVVAGVGLVMRRR